MRFFITFLWLSIASPALAHPSHIDQAGGHSHWFELAAGGLVLIMLSVWLAVRSTQMPAADNG